MNNFQTNLFNDLINLVASNEAFYKQEFMSNGHTYWIFNYRLASYTDFQAPSALEARGIMFEVNSAGELVEVKSLPFFKFFNAFENPFVANLDFSDVSAIYVKADGSLMSTYVEDSKLKLKSKGSITSEQALAAMNILTGNPTMYESLHASDVDGLTVNLEYTSPAHRIVLGYATPQLKVLNARSRETGSFVSYEELVDRFGVDNVIERIDVDDTAKFCASIDDMIDIEGYVIWMNDGRIVKRKCAWYLSLHHAKDSVNNPRRLFEAILDEGIDDLRSMFYTDVVAMKMIDEMQVKVDHLYNNMVKLVEEFYETNKHLDRKDYAIKGQTELERLYFGLAMTKYLDKPVDYKGFMKSKYKEFGVRDTQQEEV